MKRIIICGGVALAFLGLKLLRCSPSPVPPGTFSAAKSAQPLPVKDASWTRAPQTESNTVHPIDWQLHAKAPDLKESQRALSMLLDVAEHPDVLKNLNFQPVGTDLKVSFNSLRKYGLEKYGPRLQAALDDAKRSLIQYDRDNLREINSIGRDRMYFIPGSENSNIRVKLETEINSVFDNSKIAGLFISKLKQNLQSTTGDFAEQNRILVFSALGPGDEESGYPDMKFMVSTGVINPKVTLDAASKLALSRTTGSLRELVPTSDASDTAFREMPPEFKHLVE